MLTMKLMLSAPQFARKKSICLFKKKSWVDFDIFGNRLLQEYGNKLV
jgi:hypothetical protein